MHTLKASLIKKKRVSCRNMRVSYIYARLEGKSSPLKQQLIIFPTTFPIFLLFLQYFQQTKFSGFFFSILDTANNPSTVNGRNIQTPSIRYNPLAPKVQC
jgi:hypothetical protein